MNYAFWIKCDLDGRGKKFRLAVKRGDQAYFPIEDHEDYWENYVECERVAIEKPGSGGMRSV